MRAILLASATAATLRGRQVRLRAVNYPAASRIARYALLAASLQ